MYVEAKELTVDVRHLHLLRTLESAPYGNPMPYGAVKSRIESVARVFNRDDFRKGKLKLDPIFQLAINMGEIKHVQGGYVITPSGREIIPVIEGRIIQKAQRQLALNV